MKKLIIIILLFLASSCKERTIPIGRCTKCTYELRNAKLFMSTDGHFKLPRYACPNDGSLLEWGE